jgi:hypothetical protein
LFTKIVPDYLFMHFADIFNLGTYRYLRKKMALARQVGDQDVLAISEYYVNEVAPFPLRQKPEPTGPFLVIRVRELAESAPAGSLAPMPKICCCCKTDDACVAVVPCGHIELCGPCGIRVRETTNACPVCLGGSYDEEKKVILMRVY